MARTRTKYLPGGTDGTVRLVARPASKDGRTSLSPVADPASTTYRWTTLDDAIHESVTVRPVTEEESPWGLAGGVGGTTVTMTGFEVALTPHMPTDASTTS